MNKSKTNNHEQFSTSTSTSALTDGTPPSLQPSTRTGPKLTSELYKQKDHSSEDHTAGSL